VRPEERCRSDKEGDPAVTRQDATPRREEDPIDAMELRSGRVRCSTRSWWRRTRISKSLACSSRPSWLQRITTATRVRATR
jgi:hypothetical protein